MTHLSELRNSTVISLGKCREYQHPSVEIIGTEIEESLRLKSGSNLSLLLVTETGMAKEPIAKQLTAHIRQRKNR